METNRSVHAPTITHARGFQRRLQAYAAKQAMPVRGERQVVVGRVVAPSDDRSASFNGEGALTECACVSQPGEASVQHTRTESRRCDAMRRARRKLQQVVAVSTKPAGAAACWSVDRANRVDGRDATLNFGSTLTPQTTPPSEAK